MTDEQIKQNALAYATENYGEYDEHDYTDHSGSNMCHTVSEKAYIAGAHSLDEEIVGLRRCIHEFEVANKLLTQDKRNLQHELDKLRNPWISINAKLPEVKKRVLFLCNNGKAYFGYNNIDNESATITNAPDGVKVTHWMPIPQLKKGGEK